MATKKELNRWAAISLILLSAILIIAGIIFGSNSNEDVSFAINDPTKLTEGDGPSEQLLGPGEECDDDEQCSTGMCGGNCCATGSEGDPIADNCCCRSDIGEECRSNDDCRRYPGNPNDPDNPDDDVRHECCPISETEKECRHFDDCGLLGPYPPLRQPGDSCAGARDCIHSWCCATGPNGGGECSDSPCSQGSDHEASEGDGGRP